MKRKKKGQPWSPSPLFWILSICYGSAASTPTSSARISVLVELKVVNGRSHAHLSQIAVTAKHNHVSPLVSRQTASAGLEKPIVKSCGLPSSLRGAIIVANAEFMNCVMHVRVRVQFVPRMLCEVCRVIHPSYELWSEARPSPTVNRLSYKSMRGVSMPFARMPR